MRKIGSLMTAAALGSSLLVASVAGAAAFGGHGGGHGGGFGGGHGGGFARAGGFGGGFGGGRVAFANRGVGAQAFAQGGNFNRGFGNRGFGNRGFGRGIGYGAAGFGLGYGLGYGAYGDYAGYGYDNGYYDGYGTDYASGYDGGYPGYGYSSVTPYDGGYNAPLVTGRSVSTGAQQGNTCTTPVKACELYSTSIVGNGCSCRVEYGRARGRVTP